MSIVKTVVEEHPEGYVAYPVGIEGVVVGEGDSGEAALADVRSAIKFHAETFGTRTRANDAQRRHHGEKP